MHIPIYFYIYLFFAFEVPVPAVAVAIRNREKQREKLERSVENTGSIPMLIRLKYRLEIGIWGAREAFQSTKLYLFLRHSNRFQIALIPDTAESPLDLS